MLFQLQEMMSGSLKKDKEWDLKGLEPKVNVYKYGKNRTEVYSRLIFKFNLRRHSSVLSASFVFPGTGKYVLYFLMSNV